jgi:spore germination cell wall hydrolase CwlJ-like protein
MVGVEAPERGVNAKLGDFVRRVVRALPLLGDRSCLARDCEVWGRSIRSTLQERRWLLVSVTALMLVGAALALAGLPSARVSATALRPPRLAAQAPVARPPVGPGVAAVAPQTFETLTPEQAVASNAAVAFSTAPNPPAEPFKLTTDDPGERQRAATCLAMAAYYEAGNQGSAGESAVAQVVLNRLRHPFFPKSVCGVVFQGSELPTGCQFTFTCDGSLHRAPSAEGWRRAMEVAERALDGYVQHDVGEATHYHTVWVVPYWRSSVVKVAKIGAHIFYRLPGGAGEMAAFEGRYGGGPEVIPLLARGFATPTPEVTTATDQMVATPTVAEVHQVDAVPPAQLASLAALSPSLDSDGTDPPRSRREGYFGREGPDNQHIAAPGQW